MDEKGNIKLGDGFCPKCGQWLEYSCDWESVDPDTDICYQWGCECGEVGNTPYKTNTGIWPEDFGNE